MARFCYHSNEPADCITCKEYLEYPGKCLPLEADLLPRQFVINSLNAELNPICPLLALLAHHILHVSRIRVNWMVMWLVISVYTIIRRYMIATTGSFVSQPKNERVNESMTSLRSAAEYVDLYLHCPIRLHDVCLNECCNINTLSFWLIKV